MTERTFVPTVIPTLTHRTKEWIQYFQEKQEGIFRMLISKAVVDNLEHIKGILVDEIDKAAANSTEYSRYQWMRNRLVQIAKDMEAVGYDSKRRRVLIRDIFSDYAGDWDDFWDGVNAVREDLAEESESTRVLSVAQKAAFWRNKVWPSDYYYSRTMASRRSYWGDLAPWWLWLDVGNSSSFAHPRNAPTHFMDKAEELATDFILTEIENTGITLYREIDEAISRYINDPEAYQPYDILGEFSADYKWYEVYITETGRIGTRLQR